MGLWDTFKAGKVMLVCSDPCHEVEKCLVGGGCRVQTVTDGAAAVSRAQRERFDAVVLVSTGKVMDLAETVFNLRDVSRSMPIIIVADRRSLDQSPTLKEMAGHPPPNTRMFTMTELGSRMGLLGNSEKNERRQS